MKKQSKYKMIIVILMNKMVQNLRKFLISSPKQIKIKNSNSIGFNKPKKLMYF